MNWRPVSVWQLRHALVTSGPVAKGRLSISSLVWSVVPPTSRALRPGAARLRAQAFAHHGAPPGCQVGSPGGARWRPPRSAQTPGRTRPSGSKGTFAWCFLLLGHSPRPRTRWTGSRAGQWWHLMWPISLIKDNASRAGQRAFAITWSHLGPIQNRGKHHPSSSSLIRMTPRRGALALIALPGRPVAGADQVHGNAAFRADRCRLAHAVATSRMRKRDP